MPFTWLTAPDGALQLTVSGRRDLAAEHDPIEHAKIDADRRRFCGDLAVVTSLECEPHTARIEWAPVPYCRRRSGHYRTIGWNFLVTVDDGSSVVVTFRDKALTSGDRWHVSANESAEPGDFAQVNLSGELPVGAVTARALREELGLSADEQKLTQATVPFALFRVGENLGVYFHVRGELLGWSGAHVLEVHAHARDGWEGAPRIAQLSPNGFAALAQPSGWTEWSLPGLLALEHARYASGSW